tara:strand:+ start:760 stop:1506 length:747 start_codon:yes stop_codon:yes gene_type:complete
MGLEAVVGCSTVHPLMGGDGWHFDGSDPHFPSADPLYASGHLKELYLRSDDRVNGRVTVPVLWDRKKECIANNESSDIIRMFSTDFRSLGRPLLDLYPEALRSEIDLVMDGIYQPINNGVYRCGFAQTFEAYTDALESLFSALDHWDRILKQQPFLCGSTPTLADVALFTTLIRFDAVYYVHFKTSKRHIYEFEGLWGFVKRFYRLPGIAETLHMDHIKTHYFASHRQLNPRGFVPPGPDVEAMLGLQ